MQRVSDLLRRWAPLAIVSAIFFHMTAATFTSLGVVLPHMIRELGWSWSVAGVGFSLLALMVGLMSLAPAWILRRLGLRSTYAIGGMLMIAGFVCLATADTLYGYYLGAALAGCGYPLGGVVPAMHLINTTMPERRSIVAGIYMTIGGLGGVAGPLLATAVVAATGTWRDHWWIAAAVSALLTLLAWLVLPGGAQPAAATPKAQPKTGADASGPDWAYRDVVRTPQFYVIVMAMTFTLLCAVTMNTWAVEHMGNLGVSAAIAAGALSTHALINSFSRGLGGFLGHWLDPKWLLVTALVAEAIGMVSLALADRPLTIALFAIGEGYGFGMCLFATTLLLVNYFGTARNPEILGTLNLITTLAMIGPALAGAIAERAGGFAVVFLGFGAIMTVVAVAAASMSRPAQPAPQEARAAGAATEKTIA